MQQGSAEDLNDGSAFDLYVRLVSCGPACRIMRLDRAETATSIINRVQIDGGTYGTFTFIDHDRKQIDVLPFIDVAIGDAMVGAQGVDEYPSITILHDALLRPPELFPEIRANEARLTGTFEACF